MGISYSKHSNDSIVPNKQPRNSKKDRLCDTSFLVIQLVLKCPSSPPSYISSWVKNFDPLTLPARKQKIEAD